MGHPGTGEILGPYSTVLSFHLTFGHEVLVVDGVWHHWKVTGRLKVRERRSSSILDCKEMLLERLKNLSSIHLFFSFLNCPFSQRRYLSRLRTNRSHTNHLDILQISNTITISNRLTSFTPGNSIYPVSSLGSVRKMSTTETVQWMEEFRIKKTSIPILLFLRKSPNDTYISFLNVILGSPYILYTTYEP